VDSKPSKLDKMRITDLLHNSFARAASARTAAGEIEAMHGVLFEQIASWRLHEHAAAWMTWCRFPSGA
jgi:hypothetical protein